MEKAIIELPADRVLVYSMSDDKEKSFLRKFLSIKVFFAVVMITLSTILLYDKKIKSDEWMQLNMIVTCAMLAVNVGQKAVSAYKSKPTFKGK